MHIVHVIARLNDGGPVRVLRHLTKFALDAGWNVTVITGVCAEDEIDYTDLIRQKGIDVITVPALGRNIHPLTDVQAIIKIGLLLKKLRPSVVHTHTAKAGAIGRMWAHLLGTPCVHTFHGHVLHGYFSPWANTVIRYSERLLATSAHHHALTPSQAHDLHAVHKIGRPKRWHVLPIPISPVSDEPIETKPSSVPRLGFLGRLVPVKDVALWLNVLRQLQQKNAWQGIVFGDGPLRESLEKEGSDLPVSFRGQVPAAEAFAEIDVLLMTSRNEGTPLSAVEAAHAAIPVVMPAVGGCRDLGQWGVGACVPRTVTALANACQQALNQQNALAGQEAAQRFLPEQLASAYCAMYQQVAKK